MALEQIGNAITCVVGYTLQKVGVTGLTVTCSVYRQTGAATWVEVVADVAATEIGRGAYSYTLSGASVTTEGLYVFVFHTEGDVDTKDVFLGWTVGKAGIEYLDSPLSDIQTDVTAILADTATIGDGVVTVVSPVSADGEELTLVRSDDYDVTEGRGLSFSSDDWPNLTGLTSATLTVRRRAEAFGTAGEGVIFAVADYAAGRVLGAGTQTLVFELAHADTDGLLVGEKTGKFDIEVVLNARRVTVVTGTVTVIEDQTRGAIA